LPQRLPAGEERLGLFRRPAQGVEHVAAARGHAVAKMFDCQVGRIAGMGQVLIAPLEFPRRGFLVSGHGRISRLSSSVTASTVTAAVTRLGISTCILRLPAGRLFPGGLSRRTARPCGIGGFTARRFPASLAAGSILGPLILTSLRLSGSGGRRVVASHRTGCCITVTRFTVTRFTVTRFTVTRFTVTRFRRARLLPASRSVAWLTLPWFALPWLTLSWLTLPWLTLSWLALSWLTLSWLALSWLALSWLALSWLTLPWFALPWLALSWLALSRLTLPWLALTRLALLTFAQAAGCAVLTAG
jgi:hypothetical protein